MKVVDYDALRAFKARLDAAFASNASVQALVEDVNDVKDELDNITKENLTWK